MGVQRSFRLRLGKASRPIRLPPRAASGVRRVIEAKATRATAGKAARVLRATQGAAPLIARIPSLLLANLWAPVATFTVCHKTGTARYLDLWDADHFDGFTDMQRCLNQCRVWFAAEGYTTWDAPQTKTGRVNCYFRAPSAGNYVCDVQLESYAGSAEVECLIDSFRYGPLPFSGPITQPHVAALGAGYHSFRIRQRRGSFFFLSLTVWRV